MKLTYKKSTAVLKKYFHSKQLAKEFNKKNLKRAKNRKDGFQVLMSNGNYEVNLSLAYPKSLRDKVKSAKFQEKCWNKFLQEVQAKGNPSAISTDIKWIICAVSCKYEYNPSGGQDVFERHL